MGLFSHAGPAAPVAPAPALTRAGARPAGVVHLTKGHGAALTRTPLVTATVSWPHAAEYDVYALVLYRDGRVLTVSAFGTRRHPTDFSLTTPDGSVVQRCDTQRGHGATAVVEIRLSPEVAAVVPVVYSDQPNAAAPFHRDRVSMRIDNGAGQVVVVDAAHAGKDSDARTCVPGMVVNTPDGVRVEALEQYSAPGSERRPVVGPDLRVVMDAGPINAYK